MGGRIKLGRGSSWKEGQVGKRAKLVVTKQIPRARIRLSASDWRHALTRYRSGIVQIEVAQNWWLVSGGAELGDAPDSGVTQ